MPIIVIGSKEEHLTTVGNFTFHVRDTYVLEGGDLISFRDYQPTRPVQWVQFWQVMEDDAVELSVSAAVSDSVVMFINTYLGKQNIEFMCFDFAHYVTYQNTRSFSRHIEENWTFHKFNEDKLVSGDVTLLCRELPDGGIHYRHAAVYLGRGLYIWTLGAGGDLEVSDLSAMQRDFDAPIALVAQPLH